MLHIAIPCHRRATLTRCATEALRRTLAQPHAVWVVENDDPLLKGEALDVHEGSYINGRKLDAVLHALPVAAEWLFAMHSDSAPLRPGWYEWLRDRVGDGECGGFLSINGGTWPLPHPLGALYRVAWLRDTHASFLPRRGVDVGAALSPTVPAFIAAQAAPHRRPWWLRGLDVASDESGAPRYAHLGGGTIGASSWRIPRMVWPGLVRRYLDTAGVPR